MGVGAPFEFDACRPNPAMIEGVHSLGEKIAPLGDGLLTHTQWPQRAAGHGYSPAELFERGHISRRAPKATRKIRTNADRRLVSGALGLARHHAGTAPRFT